jgi:hypothetical protein
MQVFINISSRGCFYSEGLCPSAFTGWLELRWAPFLPCSQLLPGIGSIQILSYTLQRWSLVPIRDQGFVAHPSSYSRPHFSYVGPSQWSEPITIPSRDLAYPPFCDSNSGSLPSPVYTLVVVDLGILVLPDNELPPPVWLRALGNTGLGTLPLSLPQSIIDRQNHEIIRGIPHIPKLRAGRQLLRNSASVDKHEGKIQLTLPSHSRSYGWPDFTAQESLATLVINPRWTFQLQWDLHHTLTMVPLPTILGQQPFRSKPLLDINYEKRTFCF